jgi:hypothetical protein
MEILEMPPHLTVLKQKCIQCEAFCTYNTYNNVRVFVNPAP